MYLGLLKISNSNLFLFVIGIIALTLKIMIELIKVNLVILHNQNNIRAIRNKLLLNVTNAILKQGGTFSI